MTEILKVTNRPFYQHALFWIGILLYFLITTGGTVPMSGLQLLETYVFVVLLQMMVSYAVIYYLMPKYLIKGKTTLFVIYLLVLLTVILSFYILGRIYFFEARYTDYYKLVMPDYIKLSFIERIFDFQLFLSKSIRFLTPTALVLLIFFYQNQQKYLQLNEQKKTAELSALKNQLNPHFLFNTLNNLYTLALKKSDKTPDVISRLSDILDYMLYRCNDKFVSIQKEIEHIENYIALEKIRYGKRVLVDLKTTIENNVDIAPLLLLTFIENAFKHGVSQEVNQAKIDIELKANTQEIKFKIINSIPLSSAQHSQTKQGIGLQNVRKQLDLIYPDQYQLAIDAADREYRVQLNIKLI